MIRSILEDAGIKTGLIGTIGTVIGDQVIKTENTTPESYEVQKSLRRMADEGCGAAVIEASSIGLRGSPGVRFHVFHRLVYEFFARPHWGK